MKSPTPTTLKRARKKAGLSQTEAAASVHVSLRTWGYWEAGTVQMPPGLWELFQLKHKPSK